MERVHNGDPVFVDRSGRRRRLMAVAGSTGGLALALILLALVAGFTGAGPAAVPGWPDAASDGTRGTRPKPTPSRTPEPVRARTETTQPAPARRTPERAAGTSATSPPATPQPDASASPSPSVSVTSKPGNGRRPTHARNPHSAKKD